MCEADEKTHSVCRITFRYIIEIVEQFEMCPWARQARQRGEIAMRVLWGAPTLDAWVESSAALLSQPRIHVVMVVAPELACTASEFRQVRDDVAARLQDAGVADFHPGAHIDLATPLRLVPYIRRSPDPMLQLVALARLEAARGRSLPTAAQIDQAHMLNGDAPPPQPDIEQRIAVANHTRVLRNPDTLVAAIDDIVADRDRSYARLGIGTPRTIASP